MLKWVSIDQNAVTRKSCENRAPFGSLKSTHFDVLKLQVQSSFNLNYSFHSEVNIKIESVSKYPYRRASWLPVDNTLLEYLTGYTGSYHMES